MATGEDNLAELGQGHFHWFKAMEEKGLPAMEGLKAATRNIAVAYGKGDELGSVEPGKIADLLILNRNPLEAAENYRSIEMVIKEGTIVEREGLPANPILTKPIPSPSSEAMGTYGRYAISRYPSCC
jgi:cytosine/adenosine deaminase-related metal-dependent hydrolase